MSQKITHRGGCHCGAVRFEIRAPADLVVHDCNCSICSMLGYHHLFVARGDFRLLSPEEALTLYTFNTGIAKHYFCHRCGVKSYYVPRSHPHGFSVNARCLDAGTVTSCRVVPFDGANWEAKVADLPPLAE